MLPRIPGHGHVPASTLLHCNCLRIYLCCDIESLRAQPSPCAQEMLTKSL